VSLAVAEGEVVALLGPSGSGKTTLLRLLAGFETPDAGVIRLAGGDVAGLPPARRRFGMVFQHYALFPHLTVGENVAFGLEAQAWPAERTAERVREVLALVDLAGFEGRRPGAISGGQQQRVALARALAPEPRVLLLDEPLSNLDPALRERTRRELRRAIERVGITTVLVTHEQEEAFDLGDRVAVLHRGRLEQVGRPEELYETPASRFVATFVGRASVLRGEADGPFAEGETVEVRVGQGARWPAVAAFAAGAGPQPVDLAVRPEALAIRAEPLDEGGGAIFDEDSGAAVASSAGEEKASAAALASPTPATSTDLAGEVVGRRYAGPVTLYRVALEGGGEVEALAEERGLTRAVTPVVPLASGTRVHVAPRPRDDAPSPRLFPPESSPE